MPRLRRIAAIGCALAASLAAGCGGDDEETFSSAEAVTAEPVAGDTQGVSFEAYEASVEEIVTLLDEYWTEALPESFDAEYSPPDDVIAYYPDEDDARCGGEPLGPRNAFYCPADNTIAWDEPGLMIPFYAEVGDAAVGFVIAHEWGHLIQNQLEAEFPLTIESELNADCLAGTFAGALYDEGLLEGGTGLEPGTDLAEAAEGIFRAGDNPETPWQDPQAHGTADERLEAFEIGFDGGAEACADELGPGFTERL